MLRRSENVALEIAVFHQQSASISQWTCSTYDMIQLDVISSEMTFEPEI